MERQRVALITGASSGIGRACAAHLHAQGWRVFGTSRKLASEAPWTMIAMDVDDDESVQHGVNAVIAQVGRIDLVVNNAGFGYAGAIEETTIAEAKAQFETNVFGVWRVCRAVLPVMRQQRSGQIVTIGSLSGLIGIPFQGAYCASKFALEGLLETLRMELRSFGVKVVLIEPGDFNTGFARRWAVQSQTSTVYRANSARAIAVMEHDELHGSAPQQIALLLERIANTPRPRLRYRIGNPIERLAATLKHALPEWVFELAIRAYYRVK